LLAHPIPFVLLDRTALHAGSADRLTVQRNPASIYPASYPAWFFSEQTLLGHFGTSHREICRFESGDKVLHLGPASRYRGYLFERSQAAIRPQA
jgi:hypothetical protein